MADIRVDSRDLALVLDALNGMLEDNDSDLWDTERQAYERLCKVAGVEPVSALDDDSHYETRHHIPFSKSKGVMGDYIERTQQFFRGSSQPSDPAKKIADEMARASSEAIQNGTASKPAPKPSPPASEEEKERLRKLLDED